MGTHYQTKTKWVNDYSKIGWVRKIAAVIRTIHEEKNNEGVKMNKIKYI